VPDSNRRPLLTMKMCVTRCVPLSRARGRARLRNAVDSPYDQPHRKDPQVVGDREEGLTALTP